MILDGTLAEGEALPSVRTVASEFQLNPITVSKSYQALVDEGLVEKRRGLGMFVCEGRTQETDCLGARQVSQRRMAIHAQPNQPAGIDVEELLIKAQKKENESS